MSQADPKVVSLADEGDVAPLAMPKGLSAPDQRKWLVSTIKTALVAESEAQQNVLTVQAECASRSKQVGMLLLEAKKLPPKDFGEILLKVGLKLSRAYDLLKLAGGRATEEELRKDARERKQKSRAKANLPKPDSVTEPNVTESKAPASLPRPEPASPPVTESAEQAASVAPRVEDVGVYRDCGVERLKMQIEALSYDEAHDLSLWLTDHLIAIRPEHGAATKKKAA
jgi:hypothetical protein